MSTGWWCLITGGSLKPAGTTSWSRRRRFTASSSRRSSLPCDHLDFSNRWSRTRRCFEQNGHDQKPDEQLGLREQAERHIPDEGVEHRQQREEARQRPASKRIPKRSNGRDGQNARECQQADDAQMQQDVEKAVVGD